jgi:DNA polymerase
MHTILEKEEILDALAKSLRGCVKCKLHNSRTNLVFGAGNSNARLVLVGEGPGIDEDKTGYPFVGAAGIILTKMLRSINLERDEVYIANCVKCRPPRNRNPEDDEIAQCQQFLYTQLEIIEPKVVCTLGAVATQLLLNQAAPISKMRGKIHRRDRYVIVPTFHPAYLFRSYSKKKYVWEDMKLIKRLLEDKEQQQNRQTVEEESLF